MTSTPLPGDELHDRVLGGRYRMARLLGKGGMGAVWVAKDEQGDTDVAVKVVKASLLDDQAALSRFRRETRVMAGLAHDNIVRGLGAGEDEGVLWLAMELVHGQTLRERLDARGRLSWQESLTVVRQIANGLGAAHAAGVVHRDLKPENVMIVPEDDGSMHVKLLDFGVAKATLADGVESSMTGTGFIVGTPGYVAPEVVLEGKTNDPRTDFYALGVIWYEMVTGQKPFTAKTAFALAMRHAHERPPTFAEIAPFAPVPTPVESIVGRLMAKSPEERPPDTASLLLLVDGLERGAAAAAAGTPLPNAFDATVTDVRETPNGTAVVPIKLTPTPRPGEPAATPATGMGPSSSERSPSDLHLFRQLPARMKVVLVAGAVLLPLTALGVIAAVVRGPPGDVRPGDDRRGGAGTIGDAVAAAPPLVAGDAVAATVPGATEIVRSGEGITEAARHGQAPLEVDAPPTPLAKTPMADQRAPANRKPRSGTPTTPGPSAGRDPPATPPSAPVVSYGRWSLSAQGYKVKVLIDGQSLGDPPISNQLLPVGDHVLVLQDADTKAVLLTRTITIKTDEPFKLAYGQGAQ
ncbi:MAG: protein kinase [Deltaproteobacteria bacterium]|nr:protein kinase [Deltaproteobacteria bacterium]